jgi:hypothetical protein
MPFRLFCSAAIDFHRHLIVEAANCVQDEHEEAAPETPRNRIRRNLIREVVIRRRG